MQIFDTHCHYNLEPLYSGQPEYFSIKQLENLSNKNWQSHWLKAQQSGVVATLIPGASLSSSRLAVEIAKSDPNLFASVSLHPNNSEKLDLQQLTEDFAQVAQLAKDEQVIAIGETGLDYFHLSSKNFSEQSELQKKIFKLHIQLANKLHKPLIIHSRDKKDQAYQDILKILKTDYSFEKPFVLHCVSGSIDYLQAMIKLGAYLSFAGNISYDSGQGLRDLLKLVPKNRLLIETDAPFLPPQKYRGQVNQPYMIKETALFMQKEFKINPDQLLGNSFHFFDIKTN